MSSGAAVTAVAAELLSGSRAEAAPVATSWKLGGNTGVTTDGTNFLGPANVAPLIFKTKASTGSPLSEKMRIQAGGFVGINVATPAARLDVLHTGPLPAVQAINTNTASGATGVTGTCDSGTGVSGNSSASIGVSGNSSASIGVKGRGGYTGVNGDGGNYGGVFTSLGSTGAYGSGGSYGGYFAGGTYGAYGSGTSYGLYGTSNSVGVYGTGSGGGTYGSSPAVGARGVGGVVGVQGENASNSGVRGYSTYVGVWGQGDTWGVYAIPNVATGQVYGVMGANDSPSGYGVWSDGNCHVNGTLSKTAGAFKIDHPLDPENKWLSHSFVESPDMMNVYNGNIVLDGRGEATVGLPAYFTALNKDYRYQLTPIGGHAPVYIASKIDGGSFKIAGGRPGLEVSWQVTGIRQDAYAREHPIVVETPKSTSERGARAFVPQGSNARRWSIRPVSAPRHDFVPPKPEPLRRPPR